MAIPQAFPNATVTPSEAPAVTDIVDGPDGVPSDPTEVADLSSSAPVAPAAPAAKAGRQRDASGRFAKAVAHAEAAAEPDGEVDIADDPSALHEPAPAEPEVDDELGALAAEYGIAPEIAQKYGREGVEEMMALIDQRTANYVLAQLEGQQPTEEVEPAPQPQAQQFQQPQQRQQVQQPPAQDPNGYQWNYLQAPPKFDIAAALQSLDPNQNPEDIFEPEALHVLNALSDQMHQQVLSAHQALDSLLPVLQQHHENFNQITSQSQAEKQAQYERDVDSWFSELAAEGWADEFGEGPATDFGKDDPQIAKRNAVLRQMKGLILAPTLEGKPALAFNKANFRRAFSAVYHKNITNKARQQVVADFKHRTRQALPPTNGQRPQPLTGKAAANKRSADFDRRFGMANGFASPAEI